MSRLTLAFLGTFQVTLDGEAVTSFKSDKVRALLAYLAVESDRPHRREMLAGLLWPEWPERKALANLRYTLYDLRKAIGDRTASTPYLLIDRRSLQFNPASDHWLDVAAFNRALEEPADVATLRRAVALHRGTFLAGLSVADAFLFEEWTRVTRERLNRCLLEALEQLVAHHQERGEVDAVRRYLEQQLELEPWHEGAHRRLMRLLEGQGKRNAALRQYEICRQVLEAELGVAPARRTTALYERIHGGGGATKLLPDGAPLVARETQLVRLDRHLVRALAREGGVLFVTGEAGSGKTALIQGFIRRALDCHADLVAAIGCCDAHAGMGDPYLPFREILQLLVGDVEGKRAGETLSSELLRRLEALAPLTAATLADVGSELVGRFVPPGVLPHHPDLPDSTADGVPSSALFEQVTRVLQRLAQERPLLLALDDLQWADPGSVALLFHLGRRLAGSRILVVGAFRPGDLNMAGRAERHPLLPVVNELQRELGEIRIDLDEAQGPAFVEALLDAEPNRLGPEFRATLARHTGGNPLFTVELLHALQERGDLVQDTAGRWVATDTLEWDRLPARVEAVVAELVTRLPAPWQETLRIASVEGESFTAEAVARVQGVDNGLLRHRLGGPLSLAHRLIHPQGVERPQDDGLPLSRYRFRHVLFQRYLYESLDAPTRAHHHAAVGEALESLHGEGAEAVALRLAYHFEAGGLPGRAAAYLHAAGKRAYLLGAVQEALALFMRGLAVLKGLPNTPERRQQELQLQLALTGSLLARQGWGASERARALERAFDLARQRDATPDFLLALFVQADVDRAQGRLARSLELGQRMLELARRSNDAQQMVLAHWTLGETQFFRGALVEAYAHLAQGLAHYDARQHQDLTAITGPNVGVASMTWLAWTAWGLGNRGKALEWLEKGLALAERLEHALSLAFVLAVGGAGLHLMQRRPTAAKPYTARLCALVAERDLVAMAPWAEVLAGMNQAAAGDGEGGIARVRRGIAAWEASGAVTGRALQLLLLADLYRAQGRIAPALETVQQGLALIEATGEQMLEAEYHRLRGELWLASGATPYVAEAAFHKALAVARRQSARAWASRAERSLARLLRRQNWAGAVLALPPPARSIPARSIPAHSDRRARGPATPGC